jgi:hypothetical protein
LALQIGTSIFEESHSFIMKRQIGLQTMKHYTSCEHLKKKFKMNSTKTLPMQGLTCEMQMSQNYKI